MGLSYASKDIVILWSCLLVEAGGQESQRIMLEVPLDQRRKKTRYAKYEATATSRDESIRMSSLIQKRLALLTPIHLRH